MNTIADDIFSVRPDTFDQSALRIFEYQSGSNKIYRRYLELIKCIPEEVKSVSQIPFLPIEFFKTHDVLTDHSASVNKIFTSSGTTGQLTSRHLVKDLSLYEKSFRKGFEFFYGSPQGYCILALLPSYLEREGSSLVYMMEALIKDSMHPQSGFYLHEHDKLSEVFKTLQSQKQKTLVLGVTYALLDFAESHPLNFPELIVMETGGMKGKRAEMIRPEVHEILKKGFGVAHIHSEYGMTELLSQAYSKGEGIFHTPPWMKIVIHQQNDLFTEASEGHTGVISVIDLANIHSCAFLTTQDLGRKNFDGSFEVLGRSDFSDLRGCNLMVE